MCFMGFIKRFAPFALTIALGLFVASFFVTVAAPRFNFKRGKFNKHREYHRQQESEIQRLRQENSRLKEDLRQAEIKNQPSYSHDWETSESEYPLIRRNQNFQPRIENQDANRR
jgi:hypothetical protein